MEGHTRDSVAFLGSEPKEAFLMTDMVPERDSCVLRPDNMSGSLFIEKLSALEVAEKLLNSRISALAEARTAEDDANVASNVARERYTEALWGAITARLAEQGKAFCRWKSHVIDGKTKVLYVEFDRKYSGHESSGVHHLREILPVCEDCQLIQRYYKTELREDGWYVDKDGWEKVGGGTQILLGPEGLYLDGLAKELGFRPLSSLNTL
jgi:hypothetical protein